MAEKKHIHGICLLDKPSGLSSNQAMQKVKRIYHARKAGHTGSLDPLATGLLPICLGEATKASHYLLGADKAYLATCRLGQTTNTEDSEGEVTLERKVPNVTLATLQQQLLPFIGNIQQIPPIYSALKKDGVPMYKRARRGEKITMQARQVTVHAIEIKAIELPFITLEISCGSGTYIRSLVRDVGEALGCGAHLTALRRLWVTPFNQPQMVTLEQLEALSEGQCEAHLLPVKAAFSGWPEVTLNAQETIRFSQGQALAKPRMCNGLALVLGHEGQLLAIAEKREDGFVYVKRGFNLPARR